MAPSPAPLGIAMIRNGDFCARVIGQVIKHEVSDGAESGTSSHCHPASPGLMAWPAGTLTVWDSLTLSHAVTPHIQDCPSSPRGLHAAPGCEQTWASRPHPPASMDSRSFHKVGKTLVLHSVNVGDHLFLSDPSLGLQLPPGARPRGWRLSFRVSFPSDRLDLHRSLLQPGPAPVTSNDACERLIGQDRVAHSGAQGGPVAGIARVPARVCLCVSACVCVSAHVQEEQCSLSKLSSANPAMEGWAPGAPGTGHWQEEAPMDTPLRSFHRNEHLPTPSSPLLAGLACPRERTVTQPCAGAWGAGGPGWDSAGRWLPRSMGQFLLDAPRAPRSHPGGYSEKQWCPRLAPVWFTRLLP